MVERRLAIVGIMAALCIQLANGEPVAEYGPVYEKDTCKADYIKTTDCITIELDIFNDEYCCKKCPNLQQNPDPEHSNSCSDIKEQPTTELENTTPEPYTTAIIETTTAAGTTASNLPDDPKTTGVSFPEEITSEQANTMRDEIDPPVTATNLPGATIAAIVVSVIIIGVIIAALGVFYYRRKNAGYCRKLLKICRKKDAASIDPSLVEELSPVDQETAIVSDPLVSDTQQADD
ncbi:uncharacterized protein LOC120328600 [Styela clava]